MSDYGGVSTGAPNDADTLKLAFSRLKPVDRDKTAPYVTNEDREKMIAIEKAEREILADAWTRYCEGPNTNDVRSSIDEKCFTALACDPAIQPYGLVPCIAKIRGIFGGRCGIFLELHRPKIFRILELHRAILELQNGQKRVKISSRRLRRREKTLIAPYFSVLLRF